MCDNRIIHAILGSKDPKDIAALDAAAGRNCSFKLLISMDLISIELYPSSSSVTEAFGAVGTFRRETCEIL